MNKESILFNLGEALEELARTVKEVGQDPGYCEEEFRVAMEHLYHHINFAWNTRSVSSEEVNTLTDEKFSLWRTFPSDMNLST